MANNFHIVCKLQKKYIIIINIIIIITIFYCYVIMLGRGVNAWHCHNLIILDKNRENCPYDLTDGNDSF